MRSRPVLLIIDDERPMRRFLAALLSGADFSIVEANTAAEGLAMASSHLPDLVLLDLGLPDRDGLEVARQLREWTNVPILVLSAREQEDDKVDALDAGADDYLTKPFGSNELLARIRALLRRRDAATVPGTSLIECGPLRLDLQLRAVWVRDAEVDLSPTEYRLLTVLAKNEGRVLTHRQILRDVWGPGHADQAHYVRIYMAHLRRKLERDPARPELLHTEVGVGYRLRWTGG